MGLDMGTKCFKRGQKNYFIYASTCCYQIRIIINQRKIIKGYIVKLLKQIIIPTLAPMLVFGELSPFAFSSKLITQ